MILNNQNQEKINEDLLKKRIVVYDTETTGTQIRDGDRVIQFSGVEIIDGKICGFIDTLIKPLNSIENGKEIWQPIPKEAQKIHKISEDMLKDAPVFEEKMEEIIDYLKGSAAFAHNENFDINFLNSEFQRVDPTVKFDDIVERHIDTFELSRAFDPKPAMHGIDAIVKRMRKIDENFFDEKFTLKSRTGETRVVDLGIRANKDDENSRHDALVDSAILAKILLYHLERDWDLTKLKDFDEIIKPIPFSELKIPEGYEPILAELSPTDIEANNNYIEVLQNELDKGHQKELKENPNAKRVEVKAKTIPLQNKKTQPSNKLFQYKR